MKYTVLLSLLILLAGCGGEPETKSDTGPTYDMKLAKAAAEKITGSYMKELKGALMSAMNEGGAVNAIEVCNVAAPKIAEANATEHWTIERVSTQYRNPANKPSENEVAVLAKFLDTTDQENDYYAVWDMDDSGKTTFVYYKVIKTAPMCLNCHGPQDQLAEGVADKVAELYPEDKAIGYEAGEVRGMFVVTMDWPEAEEAARMLVSSDGAEPSQDTAAAH